MPAAFDFPARLGTIAPWHRWTLAAVAGALSLLSMAPFHLWPVLLVTLPTLVWLIDAAVSTSPAKPRAAAAVCWWFAFGYFMPGLLWIGEAFLVEAERFAALMPVAVLLMPAGLALFWAGAGAAAALAWPSDWRRVLVLGLALSAAEWLRGHALTGFPWNVLGYALTAPDALLQSAAVLGIYGLTLLAAVVLALPLVVWHDWRSGRSRPIAPWLALLAAIVPIAALAAWGAHRLAEPMAPRSKAMRVRLVQPSIPQREKWQRENQRRNFERHLELTGTAPSGALDGARGIDLVIWPEAAMPFLPLDIPEALAAIGRVVPENGHLAAGLLRVEPAASPARRRRIFNSLGIFAAGGRPVAMYDKIHLVPFGEYLPLQSTLEAIGLEQLTRIRGGFDVGASPRPLLTVAGLPAMGPLICYEAIFPAAVVQGGARPEALLNVTNDGWFGQTIGPYQHLHQARVRAVEEGLPLLRVANNGVSAVIDAEGRILASLGLDVVGVLDADLPPALPPPVYARMGDATFGALWLGVLALLLAATGPARIRRRQ